MAKPGPEKDKGKEKPKPKAAPAGAPKAKPQKEKPAAAPAPEAAAQEAAKAKAPPAPPRPPADPRLKVLKKFRGKFLPKGPLRERYKALMQRWDSGEDHGGVTVEELRSLYEDWKAARAR
jgi:hypothetical protein